MPHCPTPIREYANVLMAHGSGGLLTRGLVEDFILPRLNSPPLSAMDDAAVLPALRSGPVISVDAYTVRPRRFPGGDIGSLAVSGSVNDVAMAGGRPRWLTVSFIIEEGLPMDELAVVVDSLAATAQGAGVTVVAGDTKVVPRGDADGLFLTTTCVGEALPRKAPYPQPPQKGDVLLVSGPLARHGTAIAALQQLKEGQTPPHWLMSDAACLHEPAEELHRQLTTLRLMRDPTRGGLSAVLHEWAGQHNTTFTLDEASLPLREEESAYCELLGLEPLQLASEGVLAMVVGANEAEQALSILKEHKMTQEAVACGEVTATSGAEVRVTTAFGTARFLDPPVGEIVPRIC